MPLNDFIASPDLLDPLRRLVAAGRARRTLVLAGPEGVGKTTLALMLGLALNCQQPPQPGDFCGHCVSCRLAWHGAANDGEEPEATPETATPWGTIDDQIANAMAYRAAEVRSNPRETAPLSVAPHPAIRLYPPDGDFLTMAQARAVIHQTQLQPDSGQCWTLILPDFDRARWTTQAALLKTLEEPPPRLALIVLARNPLALLPTVRSRALILPLPPLAPAQLAAALLARGLAASEAEARLRAALAGGCPGRALSLDSDLYRQTRQDALEMLSLSLQPGASFTSVFRLSESLRTGKEKFESLIEILYSVIQDIVYLQSDFSEAVTNVDCLPALQQLASRLNSSQCAEAVRELDHILAAQSRNAFRPLALDSWALQLRTR